MGAAPVRPEEIHHRLAVAVADPDAHDHVARETDGPVVADVVGSAGLDGAGTAGDEQRAAGAHGRAAGLVVGEDVADDEGDARIQHLFAEGALDDAEAGLAAMRAALAELVEDFIIAVEHAADGLQGHAGALVGEDAIGLRQLQQRDIAAAEGQREAVAPGVGAEAVHAEALHDFQQARDADAAQRDHGGDVVAVGEGLAHALRAVVAVVVVARPVRRDAWAADIQLRVPEDFGRRHTQLQRRGVGHGLHGTAGLAQRRGHVDAAVDTVFVVVGAADHRQDFAAVRPRDEHGAIVHVVAGEADDLLLDGGLRQVVDAQVERGVDFQPAVGEQLGAIAEAAQELLQL